MRIMHPERGDAVKTWDPTDKMSTAEVKRVFDQLIAEGMVGVIPDVDDPGTEVITRTFDPNVKTIEVISQLQGG